MSQKPLFPSVNIVKSKLVVDDDSDHHDNVGTSITATRYGFDVDRSTAYNATVPSTSHEIQQGEKENDNLDWLTNQSFRSDDAIAIAKQHLIKTDEDARENASGVSSLHLKHPEESGSCEDSSHDDIAVSSSKFDISHIERHILKSEFPSHRPHKRSKKHQHKRDHETRSDDGQWKKSRHQDRHHKDKKKKHHKKRKRRRDDSSSGSSEESDISKTIRVAEKTSLANEKFRIDVKSDRNNLCFDRVHFTDAVVYHRLGHSCLGLDQSRQCVNWKDVKPKKKKQKEESGGVRYFSFAHLQEEGDRFPVASGLDTDLQMVHSIKESQSYIPIVDPSSQIKHDDVDPLGVYDPSTQAYIGSRVTSNPTISPQANYTSGTLTYASSSTHTKNIAYFNRNLHENPYDVQMWLEFVRFQDSAEYSKLVSTGSNQSQQDSDSSSLSNSRRKSVKLIIEKKLAILDKALLKNPNSIPLYLEQLEIGKELWDVPEQRKRWERLVRSNPNDVLLCKEYLLFHQTCFSSFLVSKVSGLYGKCFKTLTSRLEELDGHEATDMEDHLMDLFVGLCHFWRQSGHTEKAVALYQAMIELNCFCPSDIQQDTHLEGQVAFLETFWDSSEPRFGEKEAKGWRSWMLKKSRGGWEQVKMPQAIEIADEPASTLANLSKRSLWEAWVCEEVSREAHDFAPWSPDEAKGETEDDCEDPERMVLFDDISQNLFGLNSQQKKFQIVCHFLEFLGVSVSNCLVGSGNKGSDLDSKLIYSDQPSQIFSKLPSRCSGITSNCRSLEQITNISEPPENIGHEDASTENRTLEEFVEEVFQQIAPVFPEPACTQLLLMRLDFRMQRALIAKDKKQQKKQLKEAKRFVKKLLSQEENRNNLDLWAALARWEQTIGNTEEAQRVLQTALVHSGLPQTEKEKQSATRLVQTFAELFLHFDSRSSSLALGGECCHIHNMEVLNVLTTLGEGMGYSPLKDIPGQCVSSIRLLKARRNYQELITEVLATSSQRDSQDTDVAETTKWLIPSGNYVVHIAKCFAVFQYLTVGMQAAAVVFESSLSSIRKEASTSNDQQLRLEQELLTEGYVRLLSAHVYSNPTPLGALRNLIRTSLDDFPTNPTLLEAFIVSESKSHIAGRVRRYFDRETRQGPGPVLWLFAIRAEMLRQEALATNSAAGIETMQKQQNQGSLPETGISNRIRSLFQRAVESQPARHCVLLWRMYMQFEIQQHNPKRAEAIFYSALEHCPWAKVLYVDAVRHFPTKLQDCQDLLIEKELHIRAPLEEVELLIKSA